MSLPNSPENQQSRRILQVAVPTNHVPIPLALKPVHTHSLTAFLTSLFGSYALPSLSAPAVTWVRSQAAQWVQSRRDLDAAGAVRTSPGISWAATAPTAQLVHVTHPRVPADRVWVWRENQA